MICYIATPQGATASPGNLTESQDKQEKPEFFTQQDLDMLPRSPPGGNPPGFSRITLFLKKRFRFSRLVILVLDSFSKFPISEMFQALSQESCQPESSFFRLVFEPPISVGSQDLCMPQDSQPCLQTLQRLLIYPQHDFTFQND